MRIKILLVYLLLLLTSIASYSQGEPSVKRMELTVEALTSDSLGGRKVGSKGERIASDYLYHTLKSLGVVMLSGSSDGQSFSVDLGKDTVNSRNIIGIVEGCDPELKNEYIVIGAHIDNKGANEMTIDGKTITQIFPGADNNASGMACLIELADMIASTSFYFRRSVIFVGFGGMELGMAGSWYFLNKGFSYSNNISLMVDMNMLGRKDLGEQFLYYVPDSNSETITLVKEAAELGAFVFPSQGNGMSPTSDYLAFYEKGIPSVLLTTGKKRDHGTVRDREEYLDYNLMESICGYVYNLVRQAANMENKITNTNRIIGDVQEETDRLYNKNEVDRLPEFYHGDEREFLDRWVYSYIKYPELSIAAGEQGEVIVDFVIEANGKVTNVEIRKGLDDYIDAEVVKVVAASPKWKPAQVNGKKVRVKLSIPVEFKLKKK